MQPSWQLARNSLAGRPLRTMLVLGASIIACALIVTISCAFASAQQAMDMMIRGFVGDADARIIHKFSAPYDAAILEQVRSWPEVQDTLPYIGRSTSLQRVNADGELVGDAYLVTLWGSDLPAMSRFRDVELTAGALPQQPNEILIGPAVAENLDVTVGDTLAIRQAGDDPRVVVAGVIDRPRLMILQNPIARIDRDQLIALTGAADEVSTIMIRLHEDVDAEAFVETYQAALPDELTLETMVFIRAGFNRSIDSSRLGLIISAMFTFMSASFIIVIGMTAGVIERQRELAMLRAIGATRGHLAAAQLLTGALVGALGLLIGLPLGLGIAWGLVEYYDQYVPDGLAISPFGLWLTVIGAFAAGELGAIYPAWLASRVSPLEAMTRTAKPVRSMAVLLVSALALVLIAAPMLLRMVFTDPDLRFWTYGFGGLPLGFIGYFLLCVPVMIIILFTLGRACSAVLKIPFELVRGSVMGTPFRHGLTAGTLMLGIALMAGTSAVNRSIMYGWVQQMRFADGIAFRLPSITPDQVQRIAEVDGVDAVCAISLTPVQTVNEQVFGVEQMVSRWISCFGFHPDAFFEVNAVEWAQGDPEEAIPRLKAGEGLLVADRFLAARGVGVGDTITLGVDDVTAEFEILGVISSAGLDIATAMFGIQNKYMEAAISGVFMDFDVAAETWSNPNAYFVQVDMRDGVDDQALTKAIEQAVPGVQFNSAKWLQDTIADFSNRLLLVYAGASSIALLLACLAVGQVLFTNIHGRRYEFGVMRAVGAERSRLARLILLEAGLLAITGAICGSAMGLHLAYIDLLNLRQMMGIDVAMVIPWRYIGIAVGVQLLMALIAALPAVWKILRPTTSELVAVGRNE